ncbi:MAG: hypothetical protein OEM42_07050 [Deltaproteobacteria bacterium]|nr:hypothetical protein [Deltaproteobacteria bacterium]MDH3383801.1 hypothetical protein [Deltaproteobacteria bacterium]
MSDKPSRSPKEQEYTACPSCTIQIPADVPICPHCQQIVPQAERKERTRPISAGVPDLAGLWDRYGKWAKLAGPALLAVLLLAFVYQRWVAHNVKVEPNPSLPIQVEKEREGDVLILRGTVTNRGDDIPDLSLRSVAVVVEFVYRDGRRQKKTVFPKTEFRGKGALLRGETGRFEVKGPAKELREVVLRSEIVDLGMGRKLIRPRGR